VYSLGSIELQRHWPLKNTSIHPDHLAYRPDIDGLRALAVLLVVLYHAFPKWAHGGFIGVDIFFVISGFLITSIILKGLENNSFSFVWFYSKRIIRIFPALLLVLASSIFLGWIFLYPAEYQLLGKHLISAVGFFSNFTYLGEAGYFDSRAVEKPLLHLWSLAIEEQFYLIWPLLLWLASRFKARFVFLMAALWILSFSINIDYAYHDPAWDFYSPQSRFWELLSGSLLAYFALKRARPYRISERFQFILSQAMSILGLILLVVGVIATYTHSRFPGWLALLPVLGAVMMIASGPRAWVNRYLLANRMMVAIGLISYPLYLWHWILLSYAQIWGPIFIWQRIFLIGVALLLSYLTYLLIEKPLRNNSYVKQKAFLLAVCMFGVFAAGWTLNQNGFAARSINHLNQYEASGNDGGDGGYLENGCGLSDASLSNFFHGCLQDKREVANFAILGDSHAMSLLPGLVRTSQAQNRWLAIYGPGGPKNLRPYLSNSRANAAKDSLYTDRAVDQIIQNKNIQVVVLTFSSNSLLPSMSDANEQDQIEAYKGLDSVVTKLINHHKKVILMVDNPHLAQPQDCYHRQVGIAALDQFTQVEEGCEMPIAQFENLTAKYRKLLANLALAHPNSVYVFDSTPYLCSTDEGICSYKKNDRRMYAYTDHVSDYAAGQVGKPLNQYLLEIMRGK